MDMMPNNPKAVPGGPFTSPSSPPNVQPPGAQPFSPTASELQSCSASSEAKLFDNAVASSILTGYPITAEQMTCSPTVSSQQPFSPTVSSQQPFSPITSSQQPYPLAATVLQPYPVASALQPDLTPGSIIGVFSGRGGVGKSTVALLLALIAYQRGLRTALIDADLQFGDIAYLLGDKLQESVDSRPLLAFQQQAAATINNQKLLVLTAPDNVEQSELLSEAIPTIVQEVALSFDIVLINTSAFWTATQAQLARICTRLLLLMDQRATSIKACQRVLELCIKLQIPEARFSFAINGCHRFAPISIQDASLALGGQQIIGLDDGGALVDELLSIGCPGELVESSNVFIHSLEKLLDHLMPMAWGGLDATHNSYHESTKSAGFGLLKNLFKRGTRDVA
jgi:pilus assembly protein CpaE